MLTFVSVNEVHSNLILLFYTLTIYNKEVHLIELSARIVSMFQWFCILVLK